MPRNISLYFVRHGQRIDQVDSTWAFTSPSPLDPPLTDKGRLQARQTGNILRDFALEHARTPITTTSSSSTLTTFQRITPPESPDLSRVHPGPVDGHLLSSPKGHYHHFAILTSPFLRCSQTAIEIAIGIRAAGSTKHAPPPPVPLSTGHLDSKEKKDLFYAGDVVTIAVEAGLSEWLSLEYVPEPVPEAIIVQRMQDFALSRREHEPFYSVDWKYLAKDRVLPVYPESREDMQARLESTLAHILAVYAPLAADRDLSIILVTHASPVNALLEACLETPVLVPVPNCSISRCNWVPFQASEEDEFQAEEEPHSILKRSKHIQTLVQEQGHWTMDYQSHTKHLDRDYR